MPRAHPQAKRVVPLFTDNKETLDKMVKKSIGEQHMNSTKFFPVEFPLTISGDKRQEPPTITCLRLSGHHHCKEQVHTFPDIEPHRWTSGK